MQLNSVVLPAPLGPMSPTISPASTLSETSRLASRPPKRLVAACTVSRAAIALRRRARDWPAATKPPRPRQREQSGRAERGDHDDDEAVHDQVDAAAGERP